MEIQNRRPQERPLADAASEPAGGIEERSPLHDQADEMVRASDAILKNVLSGDAGRFIDNSRQEGGQ